MNDIPISTQKAKLLRRQLYDLLSFIDTTLVTAERERDGQKVDVPEKCPCCGNMHSFFHLHHILPRSVGGIDEPSNIIRLCEICHSKIHMRQNTSLSTLIKAGIKKARENGAIPGRPKKLSAEVHKKVMELRAQGLSYRQIAKDVEISKGTVCRIVKNKYGGYDKV